MIKKNVFNDGIPIAISLKPTLDAENIRPQFTQNKKRLLTIASMAILVAIAISFIAKFLIYLIYFITNVSFYGKFSIEHITPADNTLGWWVVIIPAIGGVIVGFMAL
jgi:chloride channel protein, CIC family